MDNFIKYVIKLCKESGVTLKFHPGSLYQGSAGLFGWHDKELAVATGRSGWEKTLVHEFGHLLQYRDESLLIKECDKWDYVWMNLFVDGGILTKFTKREIKLTLQAYKALEADCEKRALSLIKEFDLPFDQKDYCRRANAYIYYYDALPLLGRWLKADEKRPYEIPEILDAMPNDLNRDYKRCSAKIKRLFLKHLTSSA